MSVKILSWVWEHSQMNGPRLLVLLAIADSANNDGWCWLGMDSIAHKARLDTRNTQRYVRDVATAGEIIIYDRKAEDAAANRDYSNLYKVIVPGTNPQPPADLRGKISRRKPSAPAKSTTPTRQNQQGEGGNFTGGEGGNFTGGRVVILPPDPLLDPSGIDPLSNAAGAALPESAQTTAANDAVVQWLPADDPIFAAMDALPAEYPCDAAAINDLIAAWWEWVPLRPVRRGQVVEAKAHFANKANRAFAETLVKRGMTAPDMARLLMDIRSAAAGTRFAALREKPLTFVYAAEMLEDWTRVERARAGLYTPDAPRMTAKRPGITVRVNFDADLSVDEQMRRNPDLWLDVPRPLIAAQPAATEPDDAPDTTPNDLNLIKDIPL